MLIKSDYLGRDYLRKQISVKVNCYIKISKEVIL